MSGKRGKNISLAELKRLWLNKNLSLVEIGNMLGISAQAVYQRAKRRGFPKRGYPVNRITVWTDPELFKKMWLAGVRGSDISAYFGAAPNSVKSGVAMFNLPKRKQGYNRSISIEEFWEIELAKKMKEDAERIKALKKEREKNDKEKSSHLIQAA
jgi:hypothetical protein